MCGKKYTIPFFLILVYLLSFILRGAYACFPPTLLVYEPVEISVLSSTLGFFAGLAPAGTTAWSIGSLGLPLVFVFGFDFILKNLSAVGALFACDPSAIIFRLSAYLAEALLDPGRFLVIGRIFVALVSSCAPVAMFNFFKKQGKNWAAVTSALLFATSPFLVFQGSLVMTDAIGFTFFTLFLTKVLDDKRQKRLRDIFLMGVLFGISIAGKFPYAVFLPAALLALYFLDFNSKPCVRVGVGAVFLLSAGAALCLFVPFLWSAPVALFKNIAGNLTMDYISLPASVQAFYWVYLFRDIGMLFLGWKGWLVLVVPGTIVSFSVLGWRRALVLFFGCILFLVPLACSHSAYTRYAMPLFLFAGIYFSIFLDFLVAANKTRARVFFVVLLLVLLAGGNCATILREVKRFHSPDNLSDCINWVRKKAQPSLSVMVPRDLSIYFPPDAVTADKWLAIYRDRYRLILERVNVYFSLNRMKLSQQLKGNPLVLEVFGSMERQKIFQYELLLWYYSVYGQPPGSCQVFLYDQTGSDALTSSTADAWGMLLSRKIDFLVSVGGTVPTGLAPIKVFDSYRGPVYYVFGNTAKEERTR